MAAEMAYNLAPLLERGEPSEVMRKLARARQELSAVDYLDALAQGASAMSRRASPTFSTSTTPSSRRRPPASRRRGSRATGDPAFCTLWTLTGLPALSLPLLAGEDGLPLGVQLVGAPGGDARLLRTATALIDTLAPKKSARRARARS